VQVLSGGRSNREMEEVLPVMVLSVGNSQSTGADSHII